MHGAKSPMCHRVPGFQRFPQGSGFLQVPRVPEGFWGFRRVPKVPRFPSFPRIPNFPRFWEFPRYPTFYLQSVQGSQFLCSLRFTRFVGLTISQWLQVMFWPLIVARLVFMDIDFLTYSNIGLRISSAHAVFSLTCILSVSTFVSFPCRQSPLQH